MLELGTKMTGVYKGHGYRKNGSEMKYATITTISMPLRLYPSLGSRKLPYTLDVFRARFVCRRFQAAGTGFWE